MVFKITVIAVITVLYLYDLLLRIEHMRCAKNPVPANVADVYDEETYLNWRAYNAEETRFGIVTSTAAFVIELVLLAGNLYALFAGLFPKGDFMQMFAVLLLSAVSALLLLPFSWHRTMHIEGKYGFNRTTPKTFWADEAKNFVIDLFMMTAVGALLIWLHHALGDWLILVFAAALTLLMLGIVFLYPVLSRVFNKFTPLEDGELKEKLEDLLNRNGYRVRGIKVMDASRRTTKSNAYFTGFGKMKTIVLFDTLVEAMTPDEICAVFAHELGHGLHRDTLRLQIMSGVRMLLMALCAWLTIRTKTLFPPFCFEGVNYGFVMILVISVEFALISPLFSLVQNAFMRRAEYQADAQAVKEGYGKDLITGLKKLARQNYSELAPSDLLVKLEYTHPPLSKRIDAIEKLMQE